MKKLGRAHPGRRDPPEDLIRNRPYVLCSTAPWPEEVNRSPLGDGLLEVLLEGEDGIKYICPIKAPELPLVGVVQREPLSERHKIAEHPEPRVVLLEC